MSHDSIAKSWGIFVNIQGLDAHFQWQEAQFDPRANKLCKYYVHVYNFNRIVVRKSALPLNK